jgi:hypothetical protein
MNLSEFCGPQRIEIASREQTRAPIAAGTIFKKLITSMKHDSEIAKS